MKITETEVKYLAGLFDADGSLSFNMCKGCVRLHLQFNQKADRFELVKPLLDKIGGNTYYYTVDGKYSQAKWQLTKRADIEMLIPRLVKHMVIKGKHWNRLLESWREERGITHTDEELDELRAMALESRKDVGPLRPKKHPTWAWMAGFLDGDGCYTCRYYPKRSRWQVGLQSRIHADDKVALDLLVVGLGGEAKIDNQGYAVWRRSLSLENSSFVFRYLPKLLRHSRMKKGQIEKIIHTQRQRLSERAPKGDAIV